VEFFITMFFKFSLRAILPNNIKGYQSECKKIQSKTNYD
jgi:hypothetical protein